MQEEKYLVVTKQLQHDFPPRAKPEKSTRKPEARTRVRSPEELQSRVCESLNKQGGAERVEDGEEPER